MGLSGSQKALMFALGGVARGGATRGGYHSSKMFLSIAGTQYGAKRADPTKSILVQSLAVTDVLDQIPNTLVCSAYGFVPSAGQEIIGTLGSVNNLTRFYAGNILTTDLVYTSKPSIQFTHVRATDYSGFLLNRRKVIKKYTGQSASLIAPDIIASFTSGFTSVHVAAGLPSVDEITFTEQDVNEALDALAKRVGAYWYIDYRKDLHFFITDTSETAPRPLVPTHPTLLNVQVNKDLSQVKTRIFVEGGGVNALGEVAPGETILPVLDLAWYNATGGAVVSGPQRIRYTGVMVGGGGTLVGSGAAPSAAPVVALQAGSGVDSGAHDYAITFVTGAGESLPGPRATITTGGSLVTDPTNTPTLNGFYIDSGSLGQGSYQYVYTCTTGSGETAPSPAVTVDTTPLIFGSTIKGTQMYVPVGPTGATGRKIYRTVLNGSQFKLLDTIASNAAVWVVDDRVADGSLGANVPTSNTTVANQVSLSSIPIGGASVTSRKVWRTAAGGSQLKLLTTIADNATTTYSDSTADASLGANVPTSDTSGLTQPSGQVNAGSTSLVVAGTGSFPSTGGWAIVGNGLMIRYTGIGTGTLTGIPSSGIGAITATVSYNSTVTAASALKGIPASGAGAIMTTIKKDDPINLLVQVDDFAAQANLAALVGGDGVQEDYIQDRRLSETEARARGQAFLALRSQVQVGVKFTTRDINTRAGRTIHVDLPSLGILGDFKIQQVQIANFGIPNLMPTYEAEASSSRFSLEDLLRLARKAAA